ncbi:CBS domain-containing protein [Nitrospiraceae bacterium AH_259_D15_M11_P09]|nr:CBS domain-containing protein [Nitrospiraceae bacterium AH_259_D15_M11_P09]
MLREELKQIAVPETADLSEAMRSLKRSGRGLVVVLGPGEKVIGVLSDGDIRKALLESGDMHISVSRCLNLNFVYVREGAKRELILKLLDTRIRAIPVLDEGGRLVELVGSGYLGPNRTACSRARAPARVSLAGGGTDYTHYFMDYGGAGLSCTISKYSHALLRKRSDRRITIHSHDYRQGIEVESLEALKYDGTLDLVKAGIRLMKPDYGFDLEIGCDFPPGSGLGGSAALLASVIGCLNQFKEHRLDRYSIAEHAFEAERIELEIAGGWQDQYSTVFGGFNYLQFNRQHNVVTPLRLEPEILHELEERFILCYTGTNHLGAHIQERNHRCEEEGPAREGVHNARLKALVDEMKGSLLRGEFDDFGVLLDETWQIKKEMDSRVTNPKLELIYETAMKAGARGGRLLGTGGGGYFLFYVPLFKRYRVIEALEGLAEKPRVESVTFDENGLSSWTL